MDHSIPMVPYCPQSCKNSLQVFHRVCFSFFYIYWEEKPAIVGLLCCWNQMSEGLKLNHASNLLWKGITEIDVCRLILCIAGRVGNLSCMSFHTKVLTFRGTLTPQINFHTPSCGWVCLCAVEQSFTKISYADLTLYSPSFEYFQKSLSWTGLSLVPLLSCINHIMQPDCERR